MTEQYWRTKDGNTIAVGDMDKNHLQNVLRMLIKKQIDKEDNEGWRDCTEIDIY